MIGLGIKIERGVDRLSQRSSGECFEDHAGARARCRVVALHRIGEAPRAAHDRYRTVAKAIFSEETYLSSSYYTWKDECIKNAIARGDFDYVYDDYEIEVHPHTVQ